MFRKRARRRTIHIHVGPHKTGSTAIQHDLRDHGDLLLSKFNATVIQDRCVWELAKAANKRDEAGTEAALADVVARCETEAGDLVMSCEDLAGDLPGRSNNRRIYPHLWANINRLRRAFPKDDVRFYFFCRAPEPWLRSAYVQLLKYRTKFKSYEKYLGHLHDVGGLWDEVTERPKQRLGSNFVELPYEEGSDFSATSAFFQAAFGAGAADDLPKRPARPNSSPSPDIVFLLERANASGASHHAVQCAKQSLLERADPQMPSDPAVVRPVWPPEFVRPEWLADGLAALWSRAEGRTPQDEQPNLMPDISCDLTAYRRRPVRASDELPEAGRERMEDQASILETRLRNLPATCFLLGLVISYLRRHTGHEEHASALFQRLWDEEHAVLLGFLPTRWLISTFQTFMDHGVNEEQRMIGTAAFFLSNTMKLYEAERSLDGLPSDRTYPNVVPSTKAGFWGMDRFAVGGTDLMLNTNALILELAGREPRAGRVVQEFLLRVKRYDSAFTRMDRSRVEHNIDKPQFSDCWSFFEPPADKK